MKKGKKRTIVRFGRPQTTKKRTFVVWSGLHESLQPCSRAARKWRENEEMRRKWRENEEMERDWLSTFPHSLSISSLFLHFLPLFPFPTSKCITFCCKMLNTALLSRMSQKSQHTRYEEIILGRTCCEEAPQFVPAWRTLSIWFTLCSRHNLRSFLAANSTQNYFLMRVC